MLVRESISFERYRDPKAALGLIDPHVYIPLLQKTLKWNETHFEVPVGSSTIRGIIHTIENNQPLDDYHLSKIEYLQKFLIRRKWISPEDKLPI